MPHAVFHIIFALLVADFIREYVVKDRNKFPIHYVFIAGIAGALPDLDIAAFWILQFFGFDLMDVHRTFSHTLFLPLIFIILAMLSVKVKNKALEKRHMKLHIVFLMIALGTFTHLLLDAAVAGYISPFYPLSNFHFGLNLVGFLGNLQELFLATLDAGTFILWLFWLEYKHKISDFI